MTVKWCLRSIKSPSDWSTDAFVATYVLKKSPVVIEGSVLVLFHNIKSVFPSDVGKKPRRSIFISPLASMGMGCALVD